MTLFMNYRNILNKNSNIKNIKNEEYDIPQNLDLLNRWTIPKVEPRLIYQLGTFEKLGLKQVVKTTEESISLDNDEMIIRLLSEKDISHYRQTHKFLHIGLVQIAFKPLTLEGLPESFIATLRDGRNLNWKQSLMGIIQFSLAHEPVYFNVYPNLQLSLFDINILDALTLNVKTHGYDYMPRTEVICICYRIYYKPLFTLNPQCKRIDKSKNETILIRTNFSNSNITTRRPIKWEEITFPENWITEQAVPKRPQIHDHNKIIDILQNNEGTVNIKFETNSKSLLFQKCNSMRSYISPIDYRVESPMPSRASTSQIRETEIFTPVTEKLYINRQNIVREANNQTQDNNELEPTMSEMEFNI